MPHIPPRPNRKAPPTYSEIKAAILSRREEVKANPELAKRKRGRPSLKGDTRPPRIVKPIDAPAKVSGMLKPGMATPERIGRLAEQTALVEAHSALRAALVRSREIKRRLIANTLPDNLSGPEGERWLAGQFLQCVGLAIVQGDYEAARSGLRDLATLTGHPLEQAGAGGNVLNVNLAAMIQRLDAEERAALPSAEHKLIEANGSARDPALERVLFGHPAEGSVRRPARE